MGIEQAFTDQTLLDVVSLLSARNESGRLKFAGGTMRGAFFFSKGKLVDAHLGPFSGFQAVNLAISVGKASLSFDPSIESHTSSFKVPAERLILKERFGIETAALESSSIETATPESSSIETAALESAKPATPEPEVPVSVEKIVTTPEVPTQPLPPPVETPAQVPVQETEAGKVAAYSSSEEFFLAVGNKWSSRRNRVLLMCVIFLVVIPTTVGLASYWSNSRASTTRKFSVPKASEPSPAVAAVPAPSQPEETVTKPSPAEDPIPLRPQQSVVTAETPIKEPEIKRLNSAPVQSKEIAEVSPDPPAAPPVPSAKPAMRTITVVVEIEDGRVTEASIQQPQRELAAHEATALRLARQRRFPKGTTRRQTITLPVTREQ